MELFLMKYKAYIFEESNFFYLDYETQVVIIANCWNQNSQHPMI